MKLRRMTFNTLAITIALYVSAVASQTTQAADREKLLSEPGVYATFAAFKIDTEWWQLDKGRRDTAVAAVKDVLRRHAEHIAIDTYWLRGLSEHADVLFRTHATDLLHNQSFLVDLMGTTFGTHLVNTS